MTAKLADVKDQTFDYIIVGGGTAGLAVAARLVEKTGDSVLVLEAGYPNLDDPKILLGAQWGGTFGDPKYDWLFKSIPQKHCNDLTVVWSRGKGLGGSSAMNFYLWSKPPAADVNAWEELGNPGWNWEAFQKYTLRAENFTQASEDQLALYKHTHNAEFRGTSGPVKTTVPMIPVAINKAFLEAAQEHGFPLLEDPYGGNITGCFEGAATLDRQAKWTRSYAATAYYVPHKDNPSLTVLTEAIGARVLFGESNDGGEVATGVEFIHDEKMHKAFAKKEVILSAGSLKTPQVLELSGIGRRDILEKIGVPLEVELPGVGENMQDHSVIGITYELQVDPKVAHKTTDLLRDPEYVKEQIRLQELDEDNLYRLGANGCVYTPLQAVSPNGAPGIIQRAAAFVEEKKRSGALPPGLAEQWDSQLRTLKDETLPDIESVVLPGWFSTQSMPETGKQYVSILPVPQHPFSRGSVHAKSSDPLEHPDLDPNTFSVPFDLDIYLEEFKFARRLAGTAPFKSYVVREVDPGAAVQTDEELKEYIRTYHNTCYHACGTASMLPREKNGVVDPKLKVYGTENLRVADISVIPLHIAAHTVTAAYCIGEYSEVLAYSTIHAAHSLSTVADIITGSA
ncbi:hypothetical protein FOMPIDRAFT_1119678 [Fomitopsis schrenkii]|uniref:Glucose-methanol-choline oxidoreductase N-terminal domain-containing protein n=1 Tax=Fomitopsis schrenkii TaxID=2126942 RepID=S8FU66_FOMSC|nr:hypothetical protein FOMPIDRAFT_1119678 [Fomitopsis schrenkii]